jgi:hypothetical protein
LGKFLGFSIFVMFKDNDMFALGFFFFFGEVFRVFNICNVQRQRQVCVRFFFFGGEFFRVLYF